MNNTNEIRRILYTLKQQYGFPLSLYQRITDTGNLETGAQTIVETKYNIRKAIILPFSIFLKLFRHYGQGAFDYGGDLAIDRRVFIIDRREPVIFRLEVTNEWFIIYNHKRYSIELLENFEYEQSYFITGKELPNTLAREQIDVSLQDWVYPVDTSTNS